MALRVAFDLDGTIADMFGVLKKEAEKLFGGLVRNRRTGTAPLEAEPGAALAETSTSLSRLNLDERQRVRLWEHVESIPNFWTTLPEIEPGIVRRIAAAAVDRRWEVIFLTTRPGVAGETTQRQSQLWLEAHGFQWPSVFVVQRSRGRIADALALDALVDDRTENCLDIVAESKAHAILVHKGADKPEVARARRHGVHVVHSISGAVDLLLKIDGAKSGVVRRIRKLFKE
jgi:hypothetical protein